MVSNAGTPRKPQAVVVQDLIKRMFNGEGVIDFHIDNNFKLVQDILVVRTTGGEYTVMVDKT
jgi:hypothetical protein